MQLFNMIRIYYWDKTPPQKKKKKNHVLEADIITIKKNIDLMSLAQRKIFLLDLFQMTTIVLVSVINHYLVNGLRLFWDTPYKKRIA